tara:strand:- start:257 stop:463 length:207 start_codon:yes stop_codon:yes gene_type:complete
MKLTIEDYNIETHGHRDNCDYVISYDKNGQQEFAHYSFAKELAERMGYEAFVRVCRKENLYRFYLCHK